MASLNRVFLIGNLGQDPENRYTQGGSSVCNFRIATTERWKDRDTGDMKERTEWHRIIVWWKQSETCCEYLSKGRAVHIEGELQTRKWEDKDGNERWTTEVVADRVTLISTLAYSAGLVAIDNPSDFFFSMRVLAKASGCELYGLCWRQETKSFYRSNK